MALLGGNKKASFPVLESWPTKSDPTSAHTKLSRLGVRLFGEPSSDYERIGKENNHHAGTFIQGDTWQDSPLVNWSKFTTASAKRQIAPGQVVGREHLHGVELDQSFLRFPFDPGHHLYIRGDAGITQLALQKLIHLEDASRIAHGDLNANGNLFTL
jgi:hypothetical protein